MRIIVLIFITSIVFYSCDEKQDGSKPANPSMSGVYVYSETTMSDTINDSTIITKFHLFELFLNKDSSFVELHSNTECFGDLMDFYGNYEIHDSILVCKHKGIADWRYELGEKIKPLILALSKPFTSSFLIKKDSLIDQNDPKIRLYLSRKN